MAIAFSEQQRRKAWGWERTKGLVGKHAGYQGKANTLPQDQIKSTNKTKR